MDRNKKEMTSEEKLLNLIRKKAPEKKAEPASGPVPDLFGFERRSKTWQRDFFKIFQVGSRILMVFCLVLAVYIVINLVLYPKEKKIVLNDDLQDNNGTWGESESLTPAVRAFNEYEELARKNVFLTTGKPGGETGFVSEEAAGSAADDLTQSYKLVGIILDQSPQAIIEDIKNKQTLFLFKGEEIGGAILEKIEEGRVILLRNNQRVELTP